MVLLSALAFFLLITGLVIIHELGHYLAARKAGVEVEEFGFGLPPRAKGLFTWKGTLFSLNWIPFGGFVRLKGENVLDDAKPKPGDFGYASIPARMAILLAGVAMNFALAFVIFVFGFSYGQWIPTYLSLDDMQTAADRGEISLDLAVLIDGIIADGGAESVGVDPRSLLIAVDGQEVTLPEDVVSLQSDRQQVTYTVAPVDMPEQTTDIVVPVNDGKTGVNLVAFPLSVSSPNRNPIDASMLALRETKLVTSQTVLGIVQLLSSLAQSGSVPDEVTGIVGIAQLTYTSVQEGFMVYLRLVALLSLSLAVLNVLPFPALDGGRLLFVLAEGIFRKHNRKFEGWVNMVGFLLLLLLIFFVTFYDVIRLFR